MKYMILSALIVSYLNRDPERKERIRTPTKNKDPTVSISGSVLMTLPFFLLPSLIARGSGELLNLVLLYVWGLDIYGYLCLCQDLLRSYVTYLKPRKQLWSPHPAPSLFPFESIQCSVPMIALKHSLTYGPALVRNLPWRPVPVRTQTAQLPWLLFLTDHTVSLSLPCFPCQFTDLSVSVCILTFMVY